MSNRQQRRAEERAQKKQRAAEMRIVPSAQVRAEKKQYIDDMRANMPAEYFGQRQKVMERLMQQGISPEDLKKNYDLGYQNARRDLTRYTMAFFYSATAIAAKRQFKFGENRICRLLDDIQLIMTEEITTEDIIERCKRETGVDIFMNSYDN